MQPSCQSNFAADDVGVSSRQICPSIKQPPRLRTSMMELPQNASVRRVKRRRMRMSRDQIGGEDCATKEKPVLL